MSIVVGIDSDRHARERTTRGTFLDLPSFLRTHEQCPRAHVRHRMGTANTTPVCLDLAATSTLVL